jgi:hypothetical protein
LIYSHWRQLFKQKKKKKSDTLIYWKNENGDKSVITYATLEAATAAAAAATAAAAFEPLHELSSELDCEWCR